MWRYLFALKKLNTSAVHSAATRSESRVPTVLGQCGLKHDAVINSLRTSVAKNITDLCLRLFHIRSNLSPCSAPQRELCLTAAGKTTGTLGRSWCQFKTLNGTCSLSILNTLPQNYLTALPNANGLRRTALLSACRGDATKPSQWQLSAVSACCSQRYQDTWGSQAVQSPRWLGQDEEHVRCVYYNSH